MADQVIHNNRFKSLFFSLLTLFGINLGHYTTTYEYYGFYFSASRIFGSLPCYFDLNTLEITGKKSGWAFYYTLFINYKHVFIHWSGYFFLLTMNFMTHYACDSPVEGGGAVIQCGYFAGTAMSITVYSTMSHKLYEIRKMLKDWIKLEKKLDEILPESHESRMSRIGFLRPQFIFYYGTTIGAIVSTFLLATLKPRIPQFQNSYWLPAPDASRNQTSFWSGTLFGAEKPMGAWHYVFAVHDTFPNLNLWQAICALDLMISLMSRTILNAMERIRESLAKKEACDPDKLITIYLGLRILVADIESTLGPLIFAHEILNLFCNTVSVFAASFSMDEGNVFFIMFWLLNTIGFTVRMRMIYHPIMLVYYKSTQLRIEFANQEWANKGEFKRRVAALRNLVVRPMGLHRITPRSMSDYVLALFSNGVALRKI